MLKRIIACNDEELIEKVRREEITPHAACRKIRFLEKPLFTCRSLLLTVIGR